MFFFNKKKTLRHFGDLLFLFAIAEMGEASGKDIDDWVFNNFGFRNPSSYTYPTLLKLSGGFVPFVIADPITKKYSINPEGQMRKILKPELRELLDFIEKLKDMISY